MRYGYFRIFPLWSTGWSSEVILVFSKYVKLSTTFRPSSSSALLDSPPLQRLLLSCRNLLFYPFASTFSLFLVRSSANIPCHTVYPSSSATHSSELLNLYCSYSTFHLFLNYSYLTLAIHSRFFEDV